MTANSRGRNAADTVVRIVTSYYATRLYQSLLTVFVVASLAFVLVQALPGGPADAIRNTLRRRALQQGQDVNLERINRLVEVYSNLNPSKPLWEQYVTYMTSMMTGDLGQSIWFDDPVLEILVDALPWTLFVMSIGTLDMFIIGILLGALMAYYESSPFDVFITGWAILVSSIPFYVAAILLVYVFAYQYGWFPPQGQVDPNAAVGINYDYVVGILHHAALPIFSVILTGFGLRALNMRANSIQILGEDYIRVARLRGLSSYRIAVRYVGRNAVLPMYTGFMMSLGFMFGGAIILEEIFGYPGVGYFLFRAINARDYPLMMGSFVLITSMVVVGVLVADLTYGFIDPRVGSGTTESFSQGKSTVVGAIVAYGRRKFGGVEGPVDDEEDVDRGFRRLLTDGQGAVATDSVTDELVQEESLADRLSRRFDVWVRAPFGVIWNDWRGKVSIFVISIYLLMGTLGVMVVRRPRTNQGERLLQPFETMAAPLGTDQLGQDLLALMVHATPAMLKMIGAGALFATFMAALVGTLAGFRGGLTDRALMTVADIVLTIPGLPLVIVLASIFEPRDPVIIGLLLTVNAWGGTARQIRSQVLTVRGSEYVEASRVMGLSLHTILIKDIMPNILPFALIKFVGTARGVIFSSVGLYFLGILPYSELNWGVVLNLAYTSGSALLTWQAAHWLYVPMLTIMGLSGALIMFAQAADRLTNPRVRARHAKTVEDTDVLAGMD